MPQSINQHLSFKQVFAITFVLLMVQCAKAQTKYGITAGAGQSSLYKFPVPPEDFNAYASQLSWTAGLNIDYGIIKDKLSLFATATYNQKGYKFFNQKETGNINTLKDSSYKQSLKYVDINLNLRKKFLLGQDGESFNNFFAGTGPIVSIFTGGKEEAHTNYFGNPALSANTTNNKLTTGSGAGKYKPAYFSWGIVAGCEFGNLLVWANANIPVADYYTDAKKAEPHKIKNFGINVAYTLYTHQKKPKEEKLTKAEKRNIPVEVIDTLADRDGDGIVDIHDRCPGIKGTAKYFGCPVPDTDGDGVNDDDDKCPTIEGPVANNGCPVFRDTIKPVSKDTTCYLVYFEPAKSILRSAAYQTLDEVIKQLKANPKLKVVLKGHTDNAGSQEANYARSLGRANVCLDYMASFYITRDRLSVISLGNKAPLADLNDPLLQWKNRVVEVCVYEDK